MEIKIVTGANQVEAIKNAIHDLPQNKPVFIVVPDRQTLQIEEMLFDELNLSSTFLINVVGLTNLAIKYAGVELEPISEVEGLMYVKKAVENAFKLLLTPTPITLSIMDIYGLIHFIDETLLPDAESFYKRYFRRFRKYYW